MRSDPFTFPGKEAASSKLQGCRDQARQDGIKYFWIDTSCIDKPNHTEFSEAINSMYYWCQKSRVCYAYLYDVSSFEDMTKSRWFTRGWTLQELLAPAYVQFFSKTWRSLGDKSRLAASVSHITGIPKHFLLGADLEQASIAQRMSWASRRNTSREEDLAYCLLGIFDVHMPLLYGERLAGAFRRLQMEILQMQDDTSIFAWTYDSSKRPIDEQSRKSTTVIDTFGLLATSPTAFNVPYEVITAPLPMAYNYLQGIRTPITFDNKGLHLSLPVVRSTQRQLLAVLGCTVAGQEDSRFAIWLQDISTNDGRYVRIKDLALQRLDPIVTKYAYYQALTIEMRIFRKLPVVSDIQRLMMPSLQLKRYAVNRGVAKSVAAPDPFLASSTGVPCQRPPKRTRLTSGTESEDEAENGGILSKRYHYTDDETQPSTTTHGDDTSTKSGNPTAPSLAALMSHPASLHT